MQFPAQYKIPMQLYKMIKKLAWRCTKVLLDHNSCTRLACGSPVEVSKHFCWFLIILYNCIGILYFRGKLHVTSQQIYISQCLPPVFGSAEYGFGTKISGNTGPIIFLIKHRKMSCFLDKDICLLSPSSP